MLRVRLLRFRIAGPILASLAAGLSSLCLSLPFQSSPVRPDAASPTFYRDVLPILEQHCQSCHRRGSIAPMPFESYEQTRLFSGAIRSAVEQKTMPPWFADPLIGPFGHEHSLTPGGVS